MANQINVTDLGVYNETLGISVNVTDLGVYIESLEFTNEVDVTDLGIYIESEGGSVEVTDLGIYVETSPPFEKFFIYYDRYKLCSIQKISCKQTVSIANVNDLTDISGKKLPIIPDWQFDIVGFWCVDLSVKLDNLSNQDGVNISVFITDRNDRTIMFTNNLSFVTSFVIDSNIDNVLMYKLTIVGSGILDSQTII